MRFLDAGVAAMAQLEQLHRADGAWGVGDEHLVPYAFDVSNSDS
jgi:hypothetical protein